MDEPIAIFNGCHTFVSPTGNHRTFKIWTTKDHQKRIIALLTGADNTHDYTPFGFVDGETIAVWRTRRGQPVSPADYARYRTYADLIHQIIAREQGHPVEDEPSYVPQFKHLVEAYCIRCNRLLTNPRSIETGIGPECASRVD